MTTESREGMAQTAALLDAAIDFTGGTLGGVASVVVGQPLDTVKVKMQTYPHLYRNAFHCFTKTFSSDGLRRGLYRGTVPSLAANIAENSVLFCAYGVCQSLVARASGYHTTESMGVLGNATSGFFAAFFSSLTLCPTELVKCKLQTMSESAHSAKHISAMQLTAQIIRQEGIQAMFRGLTPTLVREMPGYFFFFGGYELSRSMMCQPGQSKDDIGSIRTMIAGGIGGWCLWISVFPADVIKSRMQVLPHNTTFLTLLVRIVQMEGVRALYTGMGPTLLRTFPATGALFLTYEYTKKVLSQFASNTAS